MYNLTIAEHYKLLRSSVIYHVDLHPFVLWVVRVSVRNYKCVLTYYTWNNCLLFIATASNLRNSL